MLSQNTSHLAYPESNDDLLDAVVHCAEGLVRGDPSGGRRRMHPSAFDWQMICAGVICGPHVFGVTARLQRARLSAAAGCRTFVGSRLGPVARRGLL